MTKKTNLLKPEEVARLLKVSRKTVIVMAREKRLPSVKIGKLVRFDEAEIERWIDRNRV